VDITSSSVVGPGGRGMVASCCRKLAPQNLDHPQSGWNIRQHIVNERTRCVRPTEREIVSREQLRRQIGRCLMALCELIAAGGYATISPCINRECWS